MKNKTLQSEIVQRFMTEKEFSDFMMKYKKARLQNRSDMVDEKTVQSVLKAIDTHGSVNEAAKALKVSSHYINSLLARALIKLNLEK